GVFGSPSSASGSDIPRAMSAWVKRKAAISPITRVPRLQTDLTIGIGVEFIFGIVLIAAPLPFDHVCVIWATWSIIRESYEIKEIVTDFKTVTPRVLSGVESIIVIVFSVLLILNPMEHHAAIHMGLLVAELILSPLVVLIDEFLLSRKVKRKTPTDKAE
ncbi:MAG: hypothetical protein IJS37_01135, partial [Bacilli bacterium]|nr:hypothetical protein [Bacilli bacterium]